MTRKYSSISVETTLASGINTTQTTMTVPNSSAATSLLGGQTLAAGNVDIFTVVIDPDTTSEEIVYVTDVNGDTLTISRGQAGTGTAGVSGIAHGAGATVRHVLTSSDLDFFRDGVASAVTTNGAQTITGIKTFSAAPVIATITNSGTLTLPTSTDTLVGRATTDTLTNKSLTKPIFTTPLENWTVSATAATGTVNLDAATSGVLYYTSNATANFTLNFRGSSTVTMDSFLGVGQAVTCVFLNTNGSTPYYATAFQIDGNAVTPKWGNGVAPAAGNASAIDAYQFTIIKTAATPTYAVLAGQVKYL
jgi:hypothetical protein